MATSDFSVIKSYSMTSLPLQFKVQHFWKIDQFTEHYTQLISKTFTGGIGADGKRIEWSLIANPHKIENGCTYLSLYLRQAPLSYNEPKHTFRGIVTLAIVNAKGDWFAKQSYEIWHPKYFDLKRGSDTFIKRCELLNSKNYCLPNGCLTIVAEIAGFIEQAFVLDPTGTSFSETQEWPVKQKMKSLLESKKFSDVTLVVDDKEFKAHKVMLATSSPVFEKMVEKGNRIDLKDITQEVVEELLQFIYTGKAPKLNRMRKELLIVAEKYALETLKSCCESALVIHLTAENAVETLKLADQYNAKRLKADTIKFIIFTNVGNLMDIPGMKEVATSQPHLVIDVLSTTMEYQKQKV